MFFIEIKRFFNINKMGPFIENMGILKMNEDHFMGNKRG
jgi:hypothetical protein